MKAIIKSIDQEPIQIYNVELITIYMNNGEVDITGEEIKTPVGYIDNGNKVSRLRIVTPNSERIINI